MALLQAGIQCELREVLLKDKPASMLQISPKGTVPVLQLIDGSVLDESLDIMRWALAGDDWLNDGCLNDDVVAGADALITYNDHTFKQQLDRYKYPQRFEGVGGVENFQAAGVFLTQLNARLLTSKFLFGDVACWADSAIFPFIRQFAAVDQQAFSALPIEALQHWLAHWLADQRFQSIMLKRQPWRCGDEPIFLF